MMEWTKKSDFELHPAGEWRAQFVEWAEDKHEKFGVQVKLTFDTEVLMDDNRPYRISTWCKPSLHKKSKVSKMLAAMGTDTEAFSDADVKAFTLDDYIGQKIRLTVEHGVKDDGTPSHKISAFVPYRKAAVRTSGAFDEAEEPAPTNGAAPETSGDKAAQQQPKPKADSKPEPAAAAAGKGKAAVPNWEEE